MISCDFDTNKKFELTLLILSCLIFLKYFKIIVRVAMASKNGFSIQVKWTFRYFLLLIHIKSHIKTLLTSHIVTFLLTQAFFLFFFKKISLEFFHILLPYAILKENIKFFSNKTLPKLQLKKY